MKSMAAVVLSVALWSGSSWAQDRVFAEPPASYGATRQVRVGPPFDEDELYRYQLEQLNQQRSRDNPRPTRSHR